jgi:hypothetical protein
LGNGFRKVNVFNGNERNILCLILGVSMVAGMAYEKQLADEAGS